MSDLPVIAKGEKGWKVRRLEILIIETIKRATQPNTCWDIYQKIRKKISTTPEEVGHRMIGLTDKGYLKTNGSDVDCGYFYQLEVSDDE